MARLLYSNENLLDDIDPFVKHPQITEYVHVLDPWGQALGREVGNTCLYGVSDIKESQAYKQCVKIWGYPGENLWFNEGADVLNMQDAERNIFFSLCRYHTHYLPTMVKDLQLAGVLLDDGATKDGCSQMPIASKDDPNRVCPAEGRGLTTCKEGIAVGIIILIVCAALVVTLVCCFAWWCMCLRKLHVVPAVPG